MNITIGITTYNRLSTLKRMAQSLYESNPLYPYSIRVYDDASTNFDKDTLQKIFFNAENIYRHPHNIGADAGMMYMYKDFLEATESDIFFNADSDLIFSKHWLETGIDLLKKTDGILSLYNTPHHPTIATNEFFCEKENLGAAGTFFTRDALQLLFANLNEDRMVSLSAVGADFGWSKFFRARGYRLYTTKNSLVQHIGFVGYNGTLDSINFGTNFSVDSITNGQILNDTVYEMSVRQKQSLRRSYALFPFELIPENAKVVLYGYGNTGKDFSEQIRKSQYCKLVAIIDAKSFENEAVKQPSTLPDMEFDYLVLATVYDDVADSMRNAAKSILPGIESKIVYKKNNGLIRL